MMKKLGLILASVLLICTTALPVFATETATLFARYTVTNVTSNVYDSKLNADLLTATAPVTLKLVDKPHRYLYETTVALTDLSDPNWRYSKKNPLLKWDNGTWSLSVGTTKTIVTSQPDINKYPEMFTMLSGQITLTQPGVYLITSNYWVESPSYTVLEVKAESGVQNPINSEQTPAPTPVVTGTTGNTNTTTNTNTENNPTIKQGIALCSAGASPPAAPPGSYPMSSAYPSINRE